MIEAVSLHLLPAGDGDCLLLQALDSSGVATTTILIDGGRKETYVGWKPTVRELLGPRSLVDLVIVTHIDADHIGGILEMLEDPDRGFSIKGIWFNGHSQVIAAQAPNLDREAFSVAQADCLSKLVEKLEIPWNEPFARGPIHTGVENPDLRVGDFAVTVVTPSQRKLAAMAGPWVKAWNETTKKEEVLPREGLERFGARAPDINQLSAKADENDTAKPNGSSIGLILEAFGRRLLLVGDCHPQDLAAAFATHTGTLTKFDVFKVSHHGARKNTTNAMLRTVEASTYAFSTDASHHDHPDDQAVAKIISSGHRAKTLAFNYRTSFTARWDDELLKDNFGYETRYPADTSPGYLRIDLFRITLSASDVGSEVEAKQS